MAIKPKFLGTAQNVTGSRYCLETGKTRLLIDCGLYQKDYRSRNWDPFFMPPNTIDVVLLTHAHTDHCGLLPKLVREGFKGRIYSTAATSDVESTYGDWLHGSSAFIRAKSPDSIGKIAAPDSTLSISYLCHSPL